MNIYANFLKKYEIKKNNKISSKSKLYNIFLKEFGKMESDYESIIKEKANKYIKNIIKKNIKDKGNNIKEIINIQIFVMRHIYI